MTVAYVGQSLNQMEQNKLKVVQRVFLWRPMNKDPKLMLPNVGQGTI